MPRNAVFVGRTLCDDIEVLHEKDRGRDSGAVGRRRMESIEDGLRAPLGMV